jgi:hypothetical protein
MNVKTAVLIALGLAVGLPYLTVVLLEGTDWIGLYLLSALFVGVILLVLWSDRNDEAETEADAEVATEAEDG